LQQIEVDELARENLSRLSSFRSAFEKVEIPASKGNFAGQVMQRIRQEDQRESFLDVLVGEFVLKEWGLALIVILAVGLITDSYLSSVDARFYTEDLLLSEIQDESLFNAISSTDIFTLEDAFLQEGQA